MEYEKFSLGHTEVLGLSRSISRWRYLDQELKKRVCRVEMQ
jgi:hypothetical protein